MQVAGREICELVYGYTPLSPAPVSPNQHAIVCGIVASRKIESLSVQTKQKTYLMVEIVYICTKDVAVILLTGEATYSHCLPTTQLPKHFKQTWASGRADSQRAQGGRLSLTP